MASASAQPDSEHSAPFQALKDHLTNEVVPSLLKAVPALSRQRMHGDYEREFMGMDGESHILFRAWAGGAVHWLTHLDIATPQLYAIRLDGWLSSPSPSPSKATATPTPTFVSTAPHLFSEITLLRTDPGEGRDNMFFFMDFPPRVDLRRYPHYLSRYYDEVRSKCVLPFNNDKATFTRCTSARAGGAAFLASPAAIYYSCRASGDVIRRIKEAIGEYARLWCTFVTAKLNPSGDDGDEVVDMEEVLACDEALKAYLHRNPIKQQMIRDVCGEDMLPLIIACMDGSARDG